MKFISKKKFESGLILLGLVTMAIFNTDFVLLIFKILFGILVLLGLLILFILSISHFSSKQFQKEYKAFLKRVNGSYYFFYNSRRSSVSFAKESVVPYLDPNIKVIFVDGRNINVGDDSIFISHMLYGVKQKKGFPYLIKVSREQPVDYSVNNLFYNTMNGRKSLEPLLKRINYFYNSPVILE